MGGSLQRHFTQNQTVTNFLFDLRCVWEKGERMNRKWLGCVVMVSVIALAVYTGGAHPGQW
jgi:hypothetical protein